MTDRLLKHLGTVLIVLLVSACSEPQVDAIPADGKILAFGDSLTYGVGAADNETYPVALEELSGIEVINKGISGETTAEGLKRFAAVMDDTRPDLVILMEGGNDILRNMSFEKARTNLAAMIETAQSRNVPVLLIGVPEKSLFGGAAPFYAELATEYDVLYIPDRLSQLLRSAEYKSDPIHLNAKGYGKLAEAMYATLQESGLL